MKHTKSIIVIALFSVLSFMQVNAAQLNDSSKALPVELKYTGTVQNQPILQLSIDGSVEENEFSISITDQSGLVLYSGSAKGEKIFKKFALNEDLGDAILSFKVTGKSSGQTVEYKISRQTTISEQMNVVRL